MNKALQFQESFEQWWDTLIRQGERDKNPYLPDLELQARIADLSPSSDHVRRIDDVLIHWLSSDDDLRWQPAVASLAMRHVARAAEPMRRAVDKAHITPTKIGAEETFLRNASDINAHRLEQQG